RQWSQRFIGPFIIEVWIAMIGAEETVANTDFVGAAVVLVVADKYIQVLVEGYIVDIAQARGEDMQIAAVGPAAENAAAFQHQLVSLRTNHVAAAISDRQVQPTVMADNHAVGIVQAN